MTAPPDILRYQTERTLDTVPAYAVGLQVKLPTGSPVYLAVSATELALYFQQDLAIHFDLEARLVKVAQPNHYWRRSLSHRVVFSRKRPATEGGGLERIVLGPDAADKLVAETHAPVRELFQHLQAGTAEIVFGKPDVPAALARIRPILERAAAFDVPAARADADRFTAIYRSVAVLPPNEYNALVLQATEGCAYNHCAFCELYKNTHFRAKEPAEFTEHVQQIVAYHGESLRARRSLFLGEANALTLPQADLVADFNILRGYFELPGQDVHDVPASWWLGNPRRFDGVGSFLDVFTGTPRTVPEWQELRRLGLRRVYIGMESGDDALLQWLRKPASATAVTKVVTALKSADIAVALIILLGAGGHQFDESHTRETARVLNNLPLRRGDYIYLSPLIIYPGGQYDAVALAQSITALQPAELDAQEHALRAQLRYDTRHDQPFIARYELETFTY